MESTEIRLYRRSFIRYRREIFVRTARTGDEYSMPDTGGMQYGGPIEAFG